MDPDLQAVQNPDHPIISVEQKQPARFWLTNCLKSRPAHGQNHAQKVSWIHLHPVKIPDHSIVSIMQERPPGPDLHTVQTQSSPLSASCRKGFLDLDLHTVQKARPLHCQVHTENGFWTLTYTLFKTPSSPLSGLNRKGFLNPDLQAIQTQPFYCQYYAEKASWTLTDNLFNSIVSIMQKMPPGSWLTRWPKPRQFHCQHHAEKISSPLPYILFKTQSSPLSASCSTEPNFYLQYVESISTCFWL